MMGPSRRIGSSRHETFAELVALPHDDLTSMQEFNFGPGMITLQWDW